MRNILILASFFIIVSQCMVDKRHTKKHFIITEDRQRIAVLDTGISTRQLYEDYMCKDMPFYTYGNNSGLDYNGHGTNVVGLIGENINSSKYCITMYAFSKNSTLKELNDMLHDMRNHNLAGLNMSLASIGYDKREEIELKGLANANVKIFIASGNEKIDLDKGCNVYPACHKLTVKNIVVVGSTDKRYSNHGKIVDIYIDGTKKGFPVKTGTSMSTAIATGLHFSK